MHSTAPEQRAEPAEMGDTNAHESDASGDPTDLKKKRPLEPHEGKDEANPNDLWSVWHSRRNLREIKRTTTKDPTATNDRAGLPRYVLMHALNSFPMAKIPGQTLSDFLTNTATKPTNIGMAALKKIDKANSVLFKLYIEEQTTQLSSVKKLIVPSENGTFVKH